MSPEERAEAWLKVMLTERRQCRSLTTIRSLASQFRAAENEALERAAKALIGCWFDCYGLTLEEAEATSEVALIRSLKSKPSEGK